jgi:hypothetical protein
MTNSTIVSTIQQSPAEERALKLLRLAGHKCIQQLDWISLNDDIWTIFEVKERALYTPDKSFPHDGSGLDLSQLWLRSQLFNKLGIRTYLMVFQKGTDNIYGQYLDALEREAGYIDTRNGIRIYPIEHFKVLTIIDGVVPEISS